MKKYKNVLKKKLILIIYVFYLVLQDVETNSKKKWNALIWASCSGFIKIVKLLISKGAATQYLENKPENRHVVLGTNKEMRPNPLHWACFKGNL